MSEASQAVRRFFIQGRVQGVGFRWFVQQHAAELGIRGYTKNLEDGRVEVFAMGTRQQLDDLSGYLWRGPRMSEVRGVEEVKASPEKVSGFRILG